MGVETTTRHALATPLRLGSIRARFARRRLLGTGPFDPHRHLRPTHHPRPGSAKRLFPEGEVRGMVRAWLASEF